MSHYHSQHGISLGESPDERRLTVTRPRFLSKVFVRKRQSHSIMDVTALDQRLADVGAGRSLSEVLRVGPSGRSGEFNTDHPSDLISNLMATGRFCFDTRAGKVLHAGALALRELSNRESLHVSVYGTRVRAHLDRVSLLIGRHADEGHCRYSLSRVAAHVTGRLGARLVRKLKGGWINLDVACSRMRFRHTSNELSAGSSESR